MAIGRFFMGDARISVTGGTTSRGLKDLEGTTLRSLGLDNLTFLECLPAGPCVVENLIGARVIVRSKTREREPKPATTKFKVIVRLQKDTTPFSVNFVVNDKDDNVAFRKTVERVAPATDTEVELEIPPDAPLGKFTVAASCQGTQQPAPSTRDHVLSLVDKMSESEYEVEADTTLRVKGGPGLTRIMQSTVLGAQTGEFRLQNPKPFGTALAGREPVKSAFSVGNVSGTVEVKSAKIENAPDPSGFRSGGLATAMVVKWNRPEGCKSLCLSQILTAMEVSIARGGVTRTFSLPKPLLDQPREIRCRDLNMIINEAEGVMGWADAPTIIGVSEQSPFQFKNELFEVRAGDVITDSRTFRTFFFCKEDPQPLLAVVDWKVAVKTTVGKTDKETTYAVDAPNATISDGTKFPGGTVAAKDEVKNAQATGETVGKFGIAKTREGKSVFFFDVLERKK